MLSFRKIETTENDIKILYQLLSERHYSISHKQMPKLQDHRSFVLNNPYREWYFVEVKKEIVGTFYLSVENHITINIGKDFYSTIGDVITWIKAEFPPLPEVKSIRPKDYQMNIPIDDVEFMRILEGMGYHKIQSTYTLAE